MPIYPRKDSPYWWIKLSINGQKVRTSSGTRDRKVAEEYEAKLRHDIYNQQRFGIKPRYLWLDAMNRYIEETQDIKSHETDIVFFRWFFKHLHDKYLDDINRDVIDKLISIKKAEGVSFATVNRYMACLNRVLRRAHFDWEWLDKLPKIRKYREPQKRVRFLSRDEFTRLLKELPCHLQNMMLFSISTGLRMSNVTGLKWSNVNLEMRRMWVNAEDIKNGRAQPIALNEDALSILKERVGIHVEYVFSFRNNPIKRVNGKAWRNALNRAGIADFRWHDLRHTFASWHVQNGTPLAILKEMGGWSDYRSVLKYAHLNADHLAPYANNVSSLLKAP